MKKKRAPVIPLFLGYGLKRYCPDSRTGEKKKSFQRLQGYCTRGCIHGISDPRREQPNVALDGCTGSSERAGVCGEELGDAQRPAGMFSSLKFPPLKPSKDLCLLAAPSFENARAQGEHKHHRCISDTFLAYSYLPHCPSGVHGRTIGQGNWSGQVPKVQGILKVLGRGRLVIQRGITNEEDRRTGMWLTLCHCDSGRKISALITE